MSTKNKMNDSELIDFIENNGFGVRWRGDYENTGNDNQWEVIWGNEDDRIAISKKGIRGAILNALKRYNKEVNHENP